MYMPVLVCHNLWSLAQASSMLTSRPHTQQWWHGMIAAVIGSALLSAIVILNSRGATLYHVGFPVYVRASAGVSGSKLFVAVRASVATIYFATQTYYVCLSICYCAPLTRLSLTYSNRVA